MLWAEIRQAYPNQWLIIEALEAHTAPDKQRHLDCLAVIDTCPDGSAALQRYRHLHQQYPLREFYFVHTIRVELDIRERAWVGVRTSHAVHTARQPSLHNGHRHLSGDDHGFPLGSAASSPVPLLRRCGP